MSKKFILSDFTTFKKLIEIIFFISAGIIFLLLGVLFLSDPVSIAIFILVVLFFTTSLPLDYLFLRNVIFICGIVFVVFGIISLFIGTLITVKTIKKRKRHEERQDYMNFDWLRHQYYELGRSLQDIATDQGVSIGMIRRWVYKLDVKSAGLGPEEE